MPEAGVPDAGNAAGRDPVERLLEEFLAARRRGQEVDLAAHTARAGDRAEELREMIDSAVLLEDMKGARPRGLALNSPQVFGDYRIVAEVGRGGMGVVYEAEQITLQRRVALKVLPSLRSESRLLRFKREAQTAAKLHHTNIVPIFGVGEQDSVHYYVMQLIVGRPLDEVLRALRGDAKAVRSGSRVRSGTSVALSATSAADALRAGAYAEKPPSGEVPPGDAAYYRSVASLGLQVADALTYAHAQGTLHRDIKPANLLLDAQGVLWVTDFGLAKVLDEETVTHSGDLVGTLQYMAPEQFGGHADARTDVHGLGLVLYELATLRPAFVADSRGELVDYVKNQEPPPASRVRPGIPRDLDTIIRKAVAKEPSHRYATAAELRDDLERFLQDRPIRARPVSVLESGWRWCRRNRVLASVGALAVLGLVSTAVASAVGYWWTRTALDTAVAENVRAEANLSLALAAFEGVFARVVGPDVLRPDDDEESDVVAPDAARRVSPEAEKLLQDVLLFYDKLAEANRDNAAARQLTARAYHRVGEIHLQLGKPAEAVASYERAVDLYGELVQSGSAATGTWLQVQNGVCRALWKGVEMERPRWFGSVDEQARAAVERAVHDLDEHARNVAQAVIDQVRDQNSPLVRYERARAHDLLGSNRFATMWPGMRGSGRDRGRAFDEAEEQHRAALALNGALLDEEPSNPSYRHATARSCRLLASCLLRSMRMETPRDDAVAAAQREEAAVLHRRAVDMLEALVAHDKRPAFREELIQALTMRAQLRIRLGDEDIAMIRRAIEHAESLVADFPSTSRYGEILIEWCVTLANLTSVADKAGARALRQRAVTVAEALVREHPEVPSFLRRLADATRALAREMLRDKDFDAAAEPYARAKQVLDRLAIGTTSGAARAATEACQLRLTAAEGLFEAGQEERARVELREAEAAFARVAQFPVEAFNVRGGRLTSRWNIAHGLAEAIEQLGDEPGDKARAAALRERFPDPRGR